MDGALGTGGEHNRRRAASVTSGSERACLLTRMARTVFARAAPAGPGADATITAETGDG